MTDKISVRQTAAFAVVSASAPVSVICGSLPWRWVLAATLPATAVVAGLMWQFRRLPEPMGLAEATKRAFGRPVLVAEALWIVLLLSRVAAQSVFAFPMDECFPFVPMVILLLAGFATYKGVCAAVRCIGVLFLFAVTLYVAIGLFSLSSVRTRELTPWGGVHDALPAFLVLLLPVSALYLGKRVQTEQKGDVRILLLLPVLAVSVALLTAGVCGQAVVRSDRTSFYLLAQSLSIFGVIERIEPLLSVVLTIGFFALSTSLLCAGTEILEQLLGSANRKTGTLGLTAAAAGGVFFVDRIPAAFWIAASIVFWVVIPAMAQGIVAGKKEEKTSKNSLDKQGRTQ